MKGRHWPFVGIGFLALVAYFPVLGGGFLWDDGGHVTAPALRSWGGLLRIWTQPGATQQYYPVLHSAFWVEHRLWGDATAGYHLINVVWHAAAACLLACGLRRLAVPGAWLAAALWVVHPVTVESVAWISEQKNTLSALFYFAAALLYLDFDAGRQKGRYAAALGCFLLAVLSKSVTATLPAALLVVLWWKRGVLRRRDVLPLLPWLALGIAMSAVTAHVEHALIGAAGSDFTLGLLQRVLLAGTALWFYAGKVLWPSDLTFIYPRWQIDPHAAGWYAGLVAAVGVFALLIWLAVGKARRGPLASGLYFAGTLAPALGFIDVYPFRYSYVADHFQYLACLGLIVPLASWAGARLPQRTGNVGQLCGAGLAVVLLILTWRQLPAYHDLFSLYETTLSRNPACWMAEGNLGSALVDAGRPTEAIDHFRRALELDPADIEAENSLGDALNKLGRPGEAAPHLERAVREQPRSPDAHNNLGVTRMLTGRASEGMAEFERALALKPDHAWANINLGLALASSGRADAALPHFEAAARAEPANASAELDWAIALTVQGRAAQALPHYQAALRLNPNSSDAHLKLGMTLQQLGRIDEANEQLAEARRLGQ